MKGTIWASSKVSFDWKKLQKLYEPIMKMQQFIEGIDEYRKIKGYGIATELSMSIMGTTINVTSQVEDIAEKTPPAGI